MMAAPLPASEPDRLQALLDYEVLDTPAEPLLDDLTRLASQICQTPVALVSLVDSERQWFKSRVGLQAQQTPRDLAFCAHAILQPDQVFEVPDASLDSRFADNPLVTGEPHVRFYAGTPLTSVNHHAIGTLCVIDHVARALTPAQHTALQTLGRHVMTVLDLKRTLSLQAQEQAANRQLARAVAQSPVQILITDAKGAITYVNAAYEQVTGFAKSEMLGKIPKVMQVSDTEPLLHEQIWQTIRAGQRWTGELSTQTKCGQPIWDHVSIAPVVDHTGEPTHYVVFKDDITERRQFRERLRAKNDELKSFAYTVSHDLKAPLRGITGYAQELVRKHQGDLTERAKFCVGQIVVASKNLDQLIEDLLKYSRLEAETPTLSTVQLDAMVQSILRDRSHTLNDLAVDLTLRIPSLALRTWERGLHQVLSNLIDNAIKYSRHAAPPRITIAAECAEDHCHLWVQDNGIGFDMKYHDRIFGLFNRLVRSAEFEGTGAGLAIVKKLMDKLGGSIHAESAPGQGATFHVELPFNPPQTKGT